MSFDAVEMAEETGRFASFQQLYEELIETTDISPAPKVDRHEADRCFSDPDREDACDAQLPTAVECRPANMRRSMAAMLRSIQHFHSRYHSFSIIHAEIAVVRSRTKRETRSRTRYRQSGEAILSRAQFCWLLDSLASRFYHLLRVLRD